jgi:hypothetical protein
MDRNISARDILGLAGSYLWALALILAGSLIGSILVPAIVGALYGLVSGDSIRAHVGCPQGRRPYRARPSGARSRI